MKEASGLALTVLGLVKPGEESYELNVSFPPDSYAEALPPSPWYWEMRPLGGN